MNVGFDLDRVFIDYPPLIPHSLIDRLYKSKVNGKLFYRIPSRGEKWLRLLTHHSFFRPPIVRNIAYLKELAANKRHKHYLISSRFGFLKNKTEELVRKHQLDELFDALHFNYNNKQPHLFKNEIIKKLRIERYVDDDLPLLRFLSNHHPKTIFFWLNKNNQSKISKNLYGIINLTQMKL